MKIIIKNKISEVIVKRNMLIFLMLLTCVSLNAEQAVTWKKINQERIRDIKNISIDTQGAIYYSSYNADDNKWSMNYSQDFKTYTQMEFEGVPTAEKYIKHGNSLYVISQTGLVYYYDISVNQWTELNIPTNYQTNDILFTENKMFLMPKFGYIYSSTNNGITWDKVNEIQLFESFYYGMNFDNALYLLRGNTIFYSTNEGASWSFVFPPAGIESFIDIEIYNNKLYLVDEEHRIYRLENNQLTNLGTFNREVYSFTINSSGSAIILSDDGVYISGSTYSSWNKVYDLYDPMPTSATFILKNRKAVKDNSIYFAVPPNDIILSKDGGNTWTIIKKDMQRVNSKMTVTNNQNSIFSLTDKKIFESINRAKSWFEIKSPPIDNSLILKIQSAVNNTLIASATNTGFYFKHIDEENWSLQNEGLTNLNITDFSINQNGYVFALTSTGLFKAQLPIINWENLNATLSGDRIICLSNNKTYLINDRVIKEIDNSGNIVETFDLSATLTTKIKDLDYNNNNFWLATEGEGIFIYNPSATPALEKITKGIITDNFVDLTNQNNIIWGYDNLNNIYISDNQQDYFQINNISEVEGIQINAINKTFDNKMLASINNNGLYIAEDVDLTKFNTEYVWLNNQNYLQHNFNAGKYKFMQFSTDGKSLMTVSEKNDTSTYKEIDIKTGSLLNSMDISYKQNNSDCGNYNFLAENCDLSFSQRFLTASFNKCDNKLSDTVLTYDIISKNLSKRISSLKGVDNLNTIENVFNSKILYTAINQMIIASPIQWAKGNPPTTPVQQYYDTKTTLVNSNTGDTVRSLNLTNFSDGHNGYLTSMVLSRENSYIAMAKSTDIGNSTYFTDIDIVDPSLNFIRNNIPLDNNISVSNILFSPDNNSIVISKSNLIFNTPSNEIDKYGEIAKYDIATKAVTAQINNIHTVSLIYSADSLSFMFSCYATENNQTVGKIYIADFNTFRLTDSITTDKNFIGKIVVSDKSEYIAMTGSDAVIRLFKNPASVTVLKAVFTSEIESINTNDSIQFYNVSTGNPQTYLWEFGDGETSNEFEPLHKYTKSGIYTISLTVSRNGITDKMTKTDYIKVFDKLNIDFSSDKTDGFYPLTVKFSNDSEGDAESWFWDFGDGNTSTEINPIHIYTKIGKFNVKLIGKNSAEQDSLIKTEYINVDNPLSNYAVDFTANMLEGNLNMEVTFSPVTSPSSTSWVWDFCDGSNSILQNPTHKFTDYGSYSIVLNASKENLGNTKTKYGYINVKRESIPDLIIDNEFEERIYKGNQIGLSGIELSKNHFIFDLSGDTIKNKISGLFDINNGNKEYRPVQMYGTLPTPRFMAYNGYNMIYLFTGLIVDNHFSIKTIILDTLGNEKYNFNITRPNLSLTPIASLADTTDYLISIYTSSNSIKLIKLNSENQFLFEKDFFAGSVVKNCSVKLINVSDGYLVVYKINNNEPTKVMKLSKNGDSLWSKAISTDNRYWFTDFNFDEEGNIIASANYKYSLELASMSSHLIKFNNNFDMLWEQKYIGSYTINAVQRFITKWGDKYYLGAGKSNDKLAFFMVTDAGSPHTFYQYNNRPGYINSMLKTKDNSVLAIGTLSGLTNNYNLYALKISAENTFSDIDDKENIGSKLTIFPNPAVNSFTLKFYNENSADAIISVKDCLGNLLSKEMYNLSLGEQLIQFSVDNFNSGIYFIEINNGYDVFRNKVIINK